MPRHFRRAGWPAGLTVDKFGDCLSFQIVSLGMERMRDDILAILAEVFRPQCIYERDDLAVREKEGMEQRKGCVYGAVPPELIIREHDALMAVDIENGQKTGHFLDQQENRGHLRPYSAGRTVLDLCCHTGGFSIHAALYGAARVQAVDVSETALAMVRGNAARNGRGRPCRDRLRQCVRSRAAGLRGGQTVRPCHLRPAAFAKSRSALDGAYRGYRELNRRCMQLTEPGGFLVTCSCSQFMTQPLFEQMLTEAAKGAGRQGPPARAPHAVARPSGHAGRGALHVSQGLYPAGAVMMKILVVEDERLLADSLQTLLTGRGFSVDTANDGLTGLEYAKTDVYDLVILDVMMPGLDGYTVASRLRAEHHAVPILMLTAKSDLMDRVAGLNAGADYYLTKPFDSRELLACVGALLRRQGEPRSTS